MQKHVLEPFISFYQFYPDMPLPQKADTSLFGSIPLRAYRYCDPFTTASSFGWYLFPPTDFALQWDGSSNIVWRTLDEKQWHHLDTANFPGVLEYYYRCIPNKEAFLPSIASLTAIREPGIVQIWTGLLAKTIPNWSILVRPPANLPRDTGYEVLEGIIETDWWFGPIITNIRLTKTDRPIIFRKRWPLFQVQPVLKQSYVDDFYKSMEVKEASDLSVDQWNDYLQAILLRNAPSARIGAYKHEAIERRREERQQQEKEEKQ